MIKYIYIYITCLNHHVLFRQVGMKILSKICIDLKINMMAPSLKFIGINYVVLFIKFLLKK